MTRPKARSVDRQSMRQSKTKLRRCAVAGKPKRTTHLLGPDMPSETRVTRNGAFL